MACNTEENITYQEVTGICSTKWVSPWFRSIYGATKEWNPGWSVGHRSSERFIIWGYFGFVYVTVGSRFGGLTSHLEALLVLTLMCAVGMCPSRELFVERLVSCCLPFETDPQKGPREVLFPEPAQAFITFLGPSGSHGVPLSALMG